MPATKIPLPMRPGQAVPNVLKSAAPGCGFKTKPEQNAGLSVDGGATIRKFPTPSIVATPQGKIGPETPQIPQPTFDRNPDHSGEANASAVKVDGAKTGPTGKDQLIDSSAHGARPTAPGRTDEDSEK
jgi:hypothetical protein